MVVRKPPLRAVPGSSDDTEPSDDDVISKRTRTDTEPSSTKSGFDASQGVVVCRGSKDLAIAETKRLLSAVHVGGTFRIENSKTDPYPYFYMVCKVCREAKLGMWVKPGAGSTWTIKSVTTASSTACVGGQSSSYTTPKSVTTASGTACVGGQSTSAIAPALAQSAVQVAVAAVAQLDVLQLIRDASPAKVNCFECREDVDEGALARCGSGTHRFCSTCFSRIVSDAVQGQNQGVCIAAKGLVPCNYCNPKSAFDMQKCATHLSKECFQAWLEVVGAIRVSEEADRWLAREKKKAREHFEALDRAGGVTDAMRVQRHYDVISETLIQPACPVCHKYIVEFDACCALQCGRRDGYVWTAGSGCGAFICAWCLETKPEKELHDHVLSCDYNPGKPKSMYPPPRHPVDWNSVMHEFARMRIKRYIEENVEERLQEQVFTEVQRRNTEIGLALQTWGTLTSDGFRQSRPPRPPVRPTFEAKITTLLDMQLADTRTQAQAILEGAENDLDLAVTFAMAQRMDR